LVKQGRQGYETNNAHKHVHEYSAIADHERLPSLVCVIDFLSQNQRTALMYPLKQAQSFKCLLSAAALFSLEKEDFNC